MSKVLLREYHALCEGGVCQDLLTEEQKIDIKENNAMYLSGLMQHADKPNGNMRVYPLDILKREIEVYKKLVKDNRALGELDHPDDQVVNLKMRLIDYVIGIGCGHTFISIKRIIVICMP